MAKDLKRLKHLGIVLVLEECETQIYCFRCAKTYKFESSDFAKHSGCKSYWFDDANKNNHVINKKINIFFGNGELEMKINIKSENPTNYTSIAKNTEKTEMTMQVPIMNSKDTNEIILVKNLEVVDSLFSQIDRKVSTVNVTGSNTNYSEETYIDAADINVPSKTNDNAIEQITNNSENYSEDLIDDLIENENSFDEKWEQSSEESDWELPVKQMKTNDDIPGVLDIPKKFGHTCYLCSDRNMSYTVYKNHLREKHDILNCNCGCGVKYPSFLEYRRHRLFYCIYCGYNGQRISKHALGTHCCPNKEFFCHICSKQFSEKPGLESHLHLTHTNFKNYRCTLCTYAAKKKNNLRVHYYMHNLILKDGEETPHLLMNEIGENQNTCNRKYNNKCYVCFKKYNLKNYTSHFFRMHGKEKCPYKCDDCSQLFNYYAEYKLHLPDKCFFCGANISNDEEHKCDSNKPKLRCNSCHYIFKHEDSFFKHNETCKKNKVTKKTFT